MRTVVLVVATVTGIGALLSLKPQSIPGFTNPAAVGAQESPLRTEALPRIGQGGPDRTITRGDNFPGSPGANDLGRVEPDWNAGDFGAVSPTDPTAPSAPPRQQDPTSGSAIPRNMCRVVVNGREIVIPTPDGRSGFVQTSQGIVPMPCLPAAKARPPVGVR